jgi:threonine dehydrogenase-like Zn-dependent dehydrogenase
VIGVDLVRERLELARRHGAETVAWNDDGDTALEVVEPRILPCLLDDADPLGTEGFATHRLPLDEAPRAYELFQAKEDGAIEIVLEP